MCERLMGCLTWFGGHSCAVWISRFSKFIMGRNAVEYLNYDMNFHMQSTRLYTKNTKRQTGMNATALKSISVSAGSYLSNLLAR